MSIVQTTLHSPLPPTEVLQVLTDFSPHRAEVWPCVDADELEVHASGPGWASPRGSRETGSASATSGTTPPARSVRS